MYRLRLDVETDIRDVKITLKTDDLLSKSVDMLKKEIAMAFRGLQPGGPGTASGALRAWVKPRRLSFSGVWSLVKIILLQPVEATSEQWQERFELVPCGLRAAETFRTDQVDNTPAGHPSSAKIPQPA